MNSDDANEAQLIDVLDTFCLGFARRDPEAVLRVCVPELDLVVVTSEEPLLRGPTELRRFVDHHVLTHPLNSHTAILPNSRLPWPKCRSHIAEAAHRGRPRCALDPVPVTDAVN